MGRVGVVNIIPSCAYIRSLDYWFLEVMKLTSCWAVGFVGSNGSIDGVHFNVLIVRCHGRVTGHEPQALGWHELFVLESFWLIMGLRLRRGRHNRGEGGMGACGDGGGGAWGGVGRPDGDGLGWRVFYKERRQVNGVLSIDSAFNRKSVGKTLQYITWYM